MHQTPTTPTTPTEKKMSKHEPRITGNEDNGFFALVVRIDRDGEENVCRGFGKHYSTKKGAEKGAAGFINKITR